jgi:hypothetical protein
VRNAYLVGGMRMMDDDLLRELKEVNTNLRSISKNVFICSEQLKKLNEGVVVEVAR